MKHVQGFGNKTSDLWRDGRFCIYVHTAVSSPTSRKDENRKRNYFRPRSWGAGGRNDGRCLWLGGVYVCVLLPLPPQENILCWPKKLLTACQQHTMVWPLSLCVLSITLTSHHTHNKPAFSVQPNRLECCVCDQKVTNSNPRVSRLIPLLDPWGRLLIAPLMDWP